MNAKYIKIFGIVLASAVFAGSAALAEGLGNRGYEGRALDQIGQSNFELRDDTANDRSAQLPVYDSGGADWDRSKVN